MGREVLASIASLLDHMTSNVKEPERNRSRSLVDVIDNLSDKQKQGVEGAVARSADRDAFIKNLVNDQVPPFISLKLRVARSSGVGGWVVALRVIARRCSLPAFIFARQVGRVLPAH